MKSLNRTKYLEESEVSIIQSRLSLDNRDDVILLIAIETGARASEILQIKTSDLFDNTQSVLIHGLKGSRDRELPLRQDLYLAIKRHAPFNITYKRLFQIWDTRRKLLNVKKKFHAFRHTFALNLYKRTRDIKLVQTALGHSSIANTMVYVDYTYTTEELRKVLIPNNI